MSTTRTRPRLSAAGSEPHAERVEAGDARVELHDGRWTSVGDPTEAALVVAARRADVDPAGLIAALPRRDAVPFDPGRRLMATLHDWRPRASGCSRWRRCRARRPVGRRPRRRRPCAARAAGHDGPAGTDRAAGRRGLPVRWDRGEDDLAGATLPMLPVQVLWVNMTTAVALGLMLAFEPEEPDLMRRPPRDPAAPIVTRALMARIALVSGLLLAGAFAVFEWQLGRGAGVAEARTATVDVFVVGQLLDLFNCRSLGPARPFAASANPALLGGVALMAGLQALFTYAPFMQAAFDSASLDALAWLPILAVGAVVSVAVGLEKRLRAGRWRRPDER